MTVLIAQNHVKIACFNAWQNKQTPFLPFRLTNDRDSSFFNIGYNLFFHYRFCFGIKISNTFDYERGFLSFVNC